MTRQDQLFSMNGATLIQLADKLGVKAACNRTRTQLKEKKENVVNRILEAEKKIADVKAEKQIEKTVEEVTENIASDGTEYTQVMKEIQQDAANAVKKVKADKHEKKERVTSEDIQALIDYTRNIIEEVGGTLVLFKGTDNFYSVKVDGHKICEVALKSRNVAIHIHSTAFDISVLDNVSLVNMVFDARVKFTKLDDTSKELIRQLLVASRDFQLNKSKNSNKEEE